MFILLSSKCKLKWEWGIICQNGYYQKVYQKINAREDMKGMQAGIATMENSMEVP